MRAVINLPLLLSDASFSQKDSFHKEYYIYPAFANDSLSSRLVDDWQKIF
jgi:hypothetical protein